MTRRQSVEATRSDQYVSGLVQEKENYNTHQFDI